jgi:hypothetical protein
VNRSSWPFGAPLALLLALVAGGCDYFKAAQPEAPEEGSFTPSYTTPDATLQTIVDAIADKARTIGLTAYGDAFADSISSSTPAYHQFFWSSDAASWEASGHTVPDWTLPLEKPFYVFFVNVRGDKYELEWTKDNDLLDDESADIVHWHRHYRVRTLAEDGSVTSVQAIGFADLTIVRFSDGNWRISRWDDRIDPNADPNDPEQVTLGRRRLNTPR